MSAGIETALCAGLHVDCESREFEEDLASDVEKLCMEEIVSKKSSLPVS